MSCTLCGSAAVRQVFRARHDRSVSSSLRVLPFGVDAHQCDDCGHVMSHRGRVPPHLDEIYARYEIFTEAPEADHLVYGVDPDGPRSRTELVMRVVCRHLPAGEGRFLDVGCNKGLMLRALGAERPSWAVHGHEISAHHYEGLRDVLEPGAFHTGALEDVGETFDFVTMLHTLEHVPDFPSALRALRGLLRPGGRLLVQVPDLAASPGDLVVYDHLSHFFLDTLCRAMEEAGLEVLEAAADALPRELTVVCRAGTVEPRRPSAGALREHARRAAAWLAALEDLVDGQGAATSVFGTGLVGTWVGGLLGARLACFVDESPWRVGTRHLGVPVVHPRELAADTRVVLGVSPALGETLRRKWDLCFLVP